MTVIQIQKAATHNITHWNITATHDIIRWNITEGMF